MSFFPSSICNFATLIHFSRLDTCSAQSKVGIISDHRGTKCSLKGFMVGCRLSEKIKSPWGSWMRSWKSWRQTNLCDCIALSVCISLSICDVGSFHQGLICKRSRSRPNSNKMIHNRNSRRLSSMLWSGVTFADWWKCVQKRYIIHRGKVVEYFKTVYSFELNILCESFRDGENFCFANDINW